MRDLGGLRVPELGHRAHGNVLVLAVPHRSLDLLQVVAQEVRDQLVHSRIAEHVDQHAKRRLG